MYTFRSAVNGGFDVVYKGEFVSWTMTAETARMQCACLNGRLESLPMQIRRLRFLEVQANEGRGINCVKTIIMFLERGDLNQAKLCCLTENDKLRNYPEINGLLYIILPDYRKMLKYP